MADITLTDTDGDNITLTTGSPASYSLTAATSPTIVINETADGRDGTNGVGIPTGGTTGQILAKNSNGDYDTVWSSAATGGVTSVNTQTGAVVLTQDNVAGGTTAKQYTATEKTKLAGIATAATANSSDATLVARANHTGTQSADTLTDGTTNKAFLATERTKLTAITGTNTGDETTATIKTKLGITTLSGSNTGDQTNVTGTAGTITGSITESQVTNLVTDLAGKAATVHTHAESDITGLTTDLAAKTISFILTAVKTANYTLAANEFVPVDTTAGNVTLTLPTAPANGTRIGAKMVVQGATNIITVTAGGTDVFNKVGGNTTVTVQLLNQGIQYQYNSGIWYGTSGDIGVTALDARYQKTLSLTTTGTTGAATLTGSTLNIPNYATGGGGTGNMSTTTYDPAGIAQQLVGTTASQTMTNKTLTAPKIINYDGVYVGTDKVLELGEWAAAGLGVNYIGVESAPAGTGADIYAGGTDVNIDLLLAAKGTGKVKAKHSGGSFVEVVTLSDTQTVTNKTATGLNLTAGTATVAPLKIPNGTILTTPANGAVEADVSDLYFTNSTPTRFKVVMDTKAQTLTNKTLTAPVISSITNTGTLTLPTTSDTLVGKATTDTLTNKTLSSAVVSGQLTFSRAALTAATTLTTTSAILEDCDATTAAFTVTLPATTTAGVQFIIKKTDTGVNAVTVSGTAIENGTSVVLRSQYDYVHLVSTTTSGTWRVLDGIRPIVWTTPSLGTGWTGFDVGGGANFGFPQYRKDSSGLVYIRGLVKNSSAGTNGVGTNATIFTLPVGFRPFQTHMSVVDLTDSFARIDTKNDGTVVLAGLTSVSTGNWISMNNICFPAEA